MTIIEQAQKTQEPGLIQQSKQEQTEEITEQTQTILDDLFQIQKEKAFSFEEIMKFMEQVGYKIIQVLGSGAFGKVIQVIDKETQIQYACKFLPSKQEYQQEKEIQQQLLDIFGDQIEEITEQLEDFNDEEQILFYQAGDCSLQEYMSWMNKLGIYWFENLQQFNGFIYKAYQLLNILFDKEVYQSDIKPDNIIITIDNEFQEIEPKIIDFGVSSLDGFSKIYGYTPSFAIDPKKGLTHLNEKKDRIFWELYQFGRTIMYLMISSVEGKIKNQINQFDFLQKNFMVSEQQLKISFQNDRQTISQTIQLLQNYYPKYLIELLQFLLLQEQSQFSISKLEDKMQMLKDNMRPMVDTQNIVGQIIANRITSRIQFDIGRVELEKEINDCFELEMFNNCILFIKLYFQKFKLIKNPYLARIYIFLLQIQGKQKEKQEFLKKITKDVKMIWKKINLKQYYLIKLQFLFILNRKEKGFIKIIQKMLTILKQLKQVNYYSEEYQIGLIIYLNKLLPMSDPESWKLFKDYNLHTPSDIKEDINNFVREQQFNSKHFYQLQIYRAMLNFDYDSKTLISFRKNQKIITNLKSIEEKMKQQELSRSYIMGILYNALGFLLQHQINHIFNQDQNIDLNKFEDKFVSYIDLKKSVEQAQLVKLAEDYQIELEYFLKTAIAIFQKSIGVNNIYQFSTHKLLINSLLKFEKFTECFKLCTLYMIELEKNPHLIQEDDFQQSAKLYISIYHQKRMQKNKNKLFQQKVQNPNVQQFKQIQQQRDSIFDHAQNDEDHVQQIQQLMHISLGLEDENEELQAKINHKKSFLIEYQKVPINKVREDDLKQSLNQNKTPKFAQKPNHQLKFNNELIQTRKNSLELVIDILKPILNKEENQFQINLTPSPKQNNQENYQQQIESDNNNNNNINNNNNNNNNNNQFLFPSKKNVNLQSEDSVSVSGVSENSSFLQQENSDYQSINSFSQNDISYQNSQEQDQIDDNTSLSDLGLHKQKMRNLYKSKSMSSISDDQEIDLDLATLFNLKNQEEQAIKEKFIDQTNHRLKKKLLKKSYFAYLQENFKLSLIYQKIFANLEQSVINRIQIKLIKLRQQLNEKEYSASYIKLCQKGLSYVQYKQQYIKEQQQEQKQVESQERYQKIHQNDKFFIYQKLFECLIYLGHYEQVSKIYLQQKRFFRKFQYRQTVMKIYTVYALYLNCNFQDCLNLLLETLYSKHISQPQHYYQKIALNAIIQIVTNNSSHKSSKLKIAEQKKQIFFQTNKNKTELQFLMNRIKKKYTQIFANKFDNILFNSAEENPKIIQQQQDNQTIKKSPNTYYIETQIKVYQEEINRPEIQIEEIEEMKQEYKQFVQQVSQSPTFYLYKQPILYLQTLIDQKYIMHLEDEKALLQSNYSNKQKSQLLPPLHEKAKSSQNIENSYYTSSSSKSLFGRQTQISRISQKIGRTFYENKNYQKAQQHYQSALQEAKEEKDKIQQIRIQYQQQQNLEMQRIQQIMKYQVQRKKVESSFY